MRKLENFRKAVESLSVIFEYDEPYGRLELAGIVALFEMTFEMAWKAMKEALCTYGYAEAQTGFPRSILKLAFKSAMIEDEESWISALTDRNDVTHSYSSEIALTIARRAKSIYFPLFEALLAKLEVDWSEC